MSATNDRDEAMTDPTSGLPASTAEVDAPDMADVSGEAGARALRLGKLEVLRGRGIDPYPVRFDRDRTCASLTGEFGSLDAGTETDVSVRVAGRLMLLRRQGKIIFATLQDGTGRVQLFLSRAEIGDQPFEDFGSFDLGDWVGAEGHVMTTRTGELSVKVSHAELLAKALRPLPDKWHGLADVDTRFRRRYVDLVMNAEARKVFEIRFRAIAAIRRFFQERGYVEVETPVLQPVPGGAAARPFHTHHNALEMDLALRIAPELYLKRLVVAGFERVYEIGRVFRNEGLSTRHNPEFTMLEAYEAFVDYTEMMVLAEELIAYAAREALSSTAIEVEGLTVDLGVPFRKVRLLDLVEERAGVAVHPSMRVEELRTICNRLGVPHEATWGSGKLVLEIYEKTTEPTIVEPTFVLDYPREVSPLARTHRDDDTLVERFELIIGGRELANAFSELNDPVDQRARLEAQANLKAAGDMEAHGVDEDYIRALEYGLPPCGGLGIGIDRLAMLLAGVHSIREVILFPHLRPEA